MNERQTPPARLHPLDAHRHPAHWGPVAAVCFVLGALVAVQVKALKSQRASSSSQRVEIVAAKYADAQEKIVSLMERVQELEAKQRKFESAAAEERTMTRLLTEELSQARVAAGFTDVTGPGIRIELSDSPLRAEIGEGQQPYVIHDQDLLLLVNELRAAEAEAIAINGQRLTATSEIRCSGPIVKVNGTPIESPYTVEAIGVPEVLEAALRLPLGVLETLEPLQFQVKITREDHLIIPAMHASQTFRLAKPVEAEEEESP